MSISVTRTKLCIPNRRDDLISRSHLDTLLIDLLDYKFALISAPAGYGKTCLMIDLAHRASYPVCWYSIDTLDKDPKRFLAHFIHAIKKQFPKFGEQSLDLLENLPDPLANPEQFTSTLIQDLYNWVTENFILFLDDFHLLDDHSQISNFIGCLGRLMDENIHMVIASRNLFNFPDLPLLIGRKQVLGVDQTDLAFQTNELRMYFQDKLNIPLSPDDSKEMIIRTDGWITGLLLRTNNTLSKLPVQNKAARVTGTDINSYFYDQVYVGLPESIKNMLLKTSLFEEFNAPFCKDFFGKYEEPSWQEFQDFLNESNLFIEEVEENGIWMRYHHLFRKFLNDQLEKQLPDEKRKILCKLVENHLVAENWEESFDAAQRLGNSRTMAEVINLSFGPLFHGGRIKLLSKWLEILPESGYEAYPLLFSLKGFISNELGNPSLGMKELNKALNSKQIENDPELRAKSLIWRATSYRFLGQYMKGIKDSRMALDLITSVKNQNEIKAEAYRELGLGYGRLGDNTKSLSNLQKSEDQYILLNRDNNIAQVQVDIGFTYVNMGKFNKAEEYIKKTIPHWKEKGNHIQLSNLMNNLGYLSLLLGRFKDSSYWLKQGEEHARLASSIRMESFILASRGDLARSIGLFKKSIEYYQKAQILSHKYLDSFLDIYIPIALSNAYRCLKYLKKAENVLQKNEELLENSASSYEHGLWYLEWGFIKLEQNLHKIALDSFISARDIFSVLDRPYEQAKSIFGLVLTTRFLLKERSSKRHIKSLEKVLCRLPTIKPLLPELNQHWSKLQELTKHLSNKSQLNKCRMELELYRDSLSDLQSSLFPPIIHGTSIKLLEIKGFGQISISLNGKKITSSEWIHQKTVREILFYILSNPNGVTKDQVGLTFWPDSSPNQLSCQFKNAVYRLRRAIGREYIVFQNDTRTYSFNWLCNYKYDVEEFQRYYQLAFDQSKKVDRIRNIRHAINLYEHPFGPQLDGIWAEVLRQKLYLSYEELILEIAAFDLKLHNFLSSKESCYAILEIEPCQEKAYQLGMKALHGLNDITGIHRLFNKCRRCFKDLMGNSPSEATIKLYQDLIQTF